MRVKQRTRFVGGFTSVLLVGLLFFISIVGVGGSVLVYRGAQNRHRLELLSRARMAAKAVNWRRLQTLTGSEEDAVSPDLLRIKEQLQMIASGDDRCLFVQLLGVRDSQVYSIAASEPAVSPPSAASGDKLLHQEDVLRVYQSGEEHVWGPYRENGTIAHAAVAIQDPKDSSAVGVFYMKVDASDWYPDALGKASIPLLIALLLSAVLWFFYVLITRSRQELRVIEESQEALRLSEQRVRHKLDALLNPEGDIATLELADIIDVPAVQALMDQFSAVVNMAMAIVDLDGNVLIQSGWQDVCRRFHRLHPETCNHCVESDTVLSKGAGPEECRLYKCKNNLWDCATPIIIGGKHLANMFLGQFFFQDEPIDYELFAERARRYGFDEQEYLAAIAKVPRWSREHVDTAMAFYRRFANLISKISLSNIKLARALTERDDLLESFRSSSARFRTLVENIPGAVFRSECVAPWRVFYMSEGVSQLMGYSAADFMEERVYWADLIEQEDIPMVQAAVDQSMNDKTAYSIDYRVMHPEGEIRWVHEAARCAFDEDGKPMYLDGVILDITAQKKAEQVSRENERWVQSIYRAAPSGMGVVNNRVMLDVNQHMCEMTGYSREELVGHNTRMLYATQEDYDEIFRHMYSDANTGQMMAESCWVKKDGSRIHVLLSSSAIDAGGSSGNVSFVATDITARIQAQEERERLQRQLLQAQKMEAVGQLAGGVAHDFNNLLQVILGQIDLMLMGPHEGVDTADLVDVKRAAERAVELTRQLLAFSRRQLIQPANLELNTLIEGVLSMIRRVIGEHIELSFAPGASLGVVCVDRGLIEQVIMNLCVNARDAMPEGGRLRLKTQAETLDEAYCSDQPWASPGSYVVLCVTDTGVGMDEETRSQIFEPFFTTKGVGRGTGLGLATVYGIVKQHNGLINVESALDRGTEFRIYFPLAEGEANQSESDALPVPPGGNETILVAEDELTVRNLIVRMLVSAGYQVLTAKDGAEAIRIADEHGEKIQLAILDVVMPHIGGQKVMEHIQTRYPNMRFLFSSGYSDGDIHSKFVIHEGLHLIQKPYLKPALLRAVRKVLDSKTA